MKAISILCYNDSMCLEKGNRAPSKQITVLPCEALHSSFRAYSTSSWLTLSRTRRSTSFLLGSTRRRRQAPRREHTAIVSDMVGYGMPSILHSATCWTYTWNKKQTWGQLVRKVVLGLYPIIISSFGKLRHFFSRILRTLEGNQGVSHWEEKQGQNVVLASGSENSRSEPWFYQLPK